PERCRVNCRPETFAEPKLFSGIRIVSGKAAREIHDQLVVSARIYHDGRAPRSAWVAAGETAGPTGSAASVGSTRTASATWSAGAAKVRPRQSRVQTLAQFVFGQRTAFVRVPIGEPFLECAFEFRARERAVFVGVGGGEDARPDESARSEPASAAGSLSACGLLSTGRTKSLWRRQHVRELFGELVLAQFASLVRVQFIEPRVRQSAELLAGELLVAVLVCLGQHLRGNKHARSKTTAATGPAKAAGHLLLAR